MAFLEIRTPKGMQRVELGFDSLTVGRLSDNEIPIEDNSISRKHCIFEPVQEKWRVRDLGSRNGTKHNGKGIDEQILAPGDVVRVGAIEITFIDPVLQEQPKSDRRETPDYEAIAKEKATSKGSVATIDWDSMPSAETDYEARLRRIIDAAPDQPFNEGDIAILDARGVTLHQATSSGVGAGKDEDDTAESIRVFRQLLLACFRSRASDLHLEPRTERSVCRLRVDGMMVTATEISTTLARRLLGVVKVICQIDTTQKAVVQDGHFSVAVKGKRVDFRVSLTPSVHGQKLVIRVLDAGGAPTRLHEMGMLQWQYEKLRAATLRDSGMVLACGPTGSGKTTTIYSSLREVDAETRNIITIEDPVEYYLEGCTQIPIDSKQGNSFGSILRSVLRQDPDVIFVGEIRDIETATVAMQASMTGHLVYTTVHSRDTIGAIFRLLDLGVESYLVANSISLIVAQRLCRLLCPHCKKPVRPTPAQTLKLGKHMAGLSSVFIPQGCDACLSTGYCRRRALFELLEFTDPLRDVVLRKPTIGDIREILSHGLFTSLQGFGLSMVAQGTTNLEEIDRVASGE
ncbi:MAG: FHA domain-containing protein [Phycisphaerales bacterium]|nr:FHA domain-containing protein [Phycisphaerales bacterium]